MPSPKRSPTRTERPAIPKASKHEAFLIAVKQKRENTRVYAVLAASAAEAVAQVEAHATDDTAIEIAGKLSKKMARSLKIAPGELRLI